jgi:hypothetical protein
MKEQTEYLYSLAKRGDWNAVLSAFHAQPNVASMCSRFRKPSSGWTFLHQAAHFGHEVAARALIRWGASPGIQSNEGETPADVAEKHGHHELSRLMSTAVRSADALWEPSPSPDLLPSSSAWQEGVARLAWHDMRVAYGDGVVVVPAGSRYYVDSFERILVGWHGTYDPPAGMDGESML